jgi:hypothetical protein
MSRQTPLSELHGFKGLNKPPAQPTRTATPKAARAEGPPSPLSPYKTTAETLICDWLVLAAATLVPAWLWWSKATLLATDVLLLFVVEAVLYHLANLARMLLTTARPGRGELPRAISAIRHLIGHGLWLAVMLGALFLAITANHQPAAFVAMAQDWQTRLHMPLILQLAAIIGAAFAFTVWRRCDYIDTHLDLPPSQFSSYGYAYIFGLGFLLITAGILRVIAGENDLFSWTASPPLIPPSALVIWLVVLRIVSKLAHLALPLWGRLMAVALEGMRRKIEAPGKVAKPG